MKTIFLKITLKDIEPPIWRRVKITSCATLLDLHYVIQHAFGWTNTHLFLVNIGSMRFVNSPDWEEDAYRFQSAELAILEGFIPKLLPKGEKFSYDYDMGDNWNHEILVENIEDSPKAFSGAVCLDGERACPPENVGSVPGYYRLLEDLRDLTDEEYVEAWGWLGYVYDPEALDLNSANLFIRDYFYAAQLSHDTLWTRDLPVYNPHIDLYHGWIERPEHHQYAEDVVFRRDVVTLMTYLRDHKVKGTKATGNFPRKDIQGITAGFVHPPILDQQIGDQLYKLRTEDEVPDLRFIHNFVNMAGLILGGEDKLWRVTHLGEIFLEGTPAEQVWFLTKFWFYHFDWDNCYPFRDVFLSDHLYTFQKFLLTVILNYPTGKPVDINRVLSEIDHLSPDWLSILSYGESEIFKKNLYFVSIVVEPFEKLGLFEVVKEEDERFSGFYNFTHIIVTEFGKNLLEYFR